MTYVIDTDIFIDHLRNFRKATTFLEHLQDNETLILYSAVTEAELIAGRLSENSEERGKILELLSIGDKIHVDNEIAIKAGDIRRQYGIAMLDAIIAATAAVKKAVLLSRNVKDFRRVKEITVKSPY